jgi:probable F420-dependent oxidoreductase
MTHPFRFGIQLDNPVPGTTWAQTAKRAEDLGYESILVQDHFEEQLGPIAALAAAAAATTTVRLGALVFGNDYRHPVVLAKEMASIDVLSGGRLQLGIGAGWMRTDYERAGLSYDRPGTRIERLIEAIDVIEGLFGAGPFSYDGAHYRLDGLDGLPKPIQARPPLLIGGGGKRMLTFAARRADIVGVTANLRSGEVSKDAIDDSLGAAYDEKLTWVRAAAGDRFDDLELSSLAMVTSVTDDRAGMLDAIGEMFESTPDRVAESPAVLVGTTDEIAESLEERRDRWGFNYPVVQQDALEDFAPVVAKLHDT